VRAVSGYKQRAAGCLVGANYEAGAGLSLERGECQSGVVFELTPAGTGEWVETVLHAVPASRETEPFPGQHSLWTRVTTYMARLFARGTTACGTPL
jgi:hypothetical protein